MQSEMHGQYKPLSDNSTYGDIFSLCDESKEGQYVWGFFCLFSFAVGFPASVAIFWEMFKTYRSSQLTPNDFLILNLSIVDALFLTLTPPGILNHFLSINLVLEFVWISFQALSLYGRPLMMACICLDCYVAVVHPIVYRQRKSLLPRVLMVAVVWTLTLATAIVYGFFNTLFGTPLPALGFLIGIVVIVICDGFIIRAILKSDRGRRNIHPQKQRAIQTLTVSLLMAVICYIPPVFSYMLGSLLTKNAQVFACKIAYPISVTSTLGSALMPLLSLYNYGKFRFMKPACCKI